MVEPSAINGMQNRAIEEIGTHVKSLAKSVAKTEGMMETVREQNRATNTKLDKLIESTGVAKGERGGLGRSIDGVRDMAKANTKEIRAVHKKGATISAASGFLGGAAAVLAKMAFWK